MPDEIMEEISVGTLKISAFLTSVGKPAEGVRVTVSYPDSGEVIAEGVTDAEGKLSPLLLPAPPEEYSLTPPDSTDNAIEDESETGGSWVEPPAEETNTDENQEVVTPNEITDIEPISEEAEQPVPYGAYNITAETEDGDVTNIFNAQIYSGIISLQSIVFPGQNDEINIPSPAIMGGFPEKIPESETKRLPSTGGLVVLPKPVVPGLIVVHSGVPSDTDAPNYTVTFKDYVKNVASSEIFATWPREALKANIIAICSFTMNRVFTEWYRGKGYSFTVTNSTAYDQAFTYGRTIFSEISEVVDEVFTLYITREGITQPLLTQYSDGIRVKRSGWLSQWGSKELADDGYNALQILRYYYGRDIILREAEKVEGIPLSFQGVLSIGSSGEAVRTIQRQLNAISNNFPLIPKLAVDGIFGPKTAESVKVFQQIFNLPVNGIVNFGTWYAISDIYTAVENLA